MSFLRRLIPSFLLRWDLWLQEHWPRLWSTRLHLHLWFLLLLNAAVLVLGLVLPVSTYSFPDPEEVWGYMMVPTVVYACFWVYRVVLFTVERRFGVRKPYAEVGELLLHCLSLVLILTLPMTLSVTLAFRIGQLVSDEQINADVNAMNELEPWLYGNNELEEEEVDDGVLTTDLVAEAEMAALQETVQARRVYRSEQGGGTHSFFRSVEEYRRRHKRPDSEVETERDLHDLYEDHISAYNEVSDPDDTALFDPDTAAYHKQIADSIEANFSLLRTQLGSFTPFDEWSGRAMATDSALEVHYLARFTGAGPPDTATIAATLRSGRTYSRNVRLLAPDRVLQEFTDRKASTTSLWSAERRIRDIAEAKAYDYDFLEPYAILYGMLLTCFGLALLLSIFKNLYWQPFLIAAVTAAVLPILILILSLITAEMVFHLEEERFMLWTYYLLVLCILAVQLRVPLLKAYRPVPAVLNILANVAAPVFPLFTLFLLHQEFDVFGQAALQERIYETADVVHLAALHAQLERQMEILQARIAVYMLSAGWGGVALYTFALHPLFRWCQTRLMALPERK